MCGTKPNHITIFQKVLCVHTTFSFVLIVASSAAVAVAAASPILSPAVAAVNDLRRARPLVPLLRNCCSSAARRGASKMCVTWSPQRHILLMLI